MDPLPPQPPFPPFPTATITAAAVPVSVPTDASTLTPVVSTITTATAVTGEATNNNNHIAHAANPTPTAAQSFNHPPYADMIYAAITALKERDGSSKRAIGKYIEKAYTGLPQTHSALLTHHLKRLKSSGLLEMVKKSYKLPSSRSDSDNITNNNNNSNSVVATTQSQPHPAVSATSLSGGPKRGRGRPPKPKSNSPQPIDYQPNNNNNNSNNNNIVANSQPIMVPVGLSFTTQNIPPTAPNFISQPNFTLPPPNPPNLAGVPVVAPPPAVTQLQQLGKRGPGRPKKVVGGGSGVPVMVGKRRGRPPKSISLGTKKSPGRPKKPKSVASNGIKKVPKRLPKSVVVPYATGGAVATGAGAAAALNEPRPRGRPKKAAAVLTAAGGAVLVPARRPGRPPKVVGGIMKPKKGRPAGRPRKNVNVSWALTDQPQVEAYGDLKRKFEIFQSKVKQAVGVLKPQLTGETAISAVAELEGLASMDINMPLREEAQPPVIQN